MFEQLLQADALVSLATLTALEVVLGIDNVIFISILAGKLPEESRATARKAGLFGAFSTRLVFLSLASYIVTLTNPLMTIAGFDLSGKSLILLAGGLFLLYKATKEIHHKLEQESEVKGVALKATLAAVISQIMLLDIVFSIDSVITAVGMTSNLTIMVLANVIALIVMLAGSGWISNFVDKHPSIKMLALSFLLMIGLVLIAEAFQVHIPKGYVYFAMGFSVFVEILNIVVNRRTAAVKLHQDGPR